MAGFIPYYFQAATELGAPGAKLTHLAGLLQHAATYDVKSYIPHGIEIAYSPAAMRNIEQWVGSESAGIMFVYGEYDPWSAGAFAARGGSDSYFYLQSGGNHGSNIFALNEQQRTEALQVLGRWLGKNVTDDAPVVTGLALEDYEFAFRAKARLP